LLPLELELSGNTQDFIVTMHLEDDEWRIDDFGPWEKNDLGLAKLLHRPTEMEQNEAAAIETINTLIGALQRYASRFPKTGFPFNLRMLTTSTESENIYAGKEPLLDESFAADPLIKNGYVSDTCSRAWEMGSNKAGAAMRSRPLRLSLAKRDQKTIWPTQISM
jgi:hypothetical protein